MMKSAHVYFVWLLAVHEGFSLLGPTRLLPLVVADDVGHGDEEQEDADSGHHHEPADYDPENENAENVCRRNPTWQRQADDVIATLDYATCQELSGWAPRDVWWREDPYPAAHWLSDGKEQQIAECLHEAMRNVDGTLWWARYVFAVVSTYTACSCRIATVVLFLNGM
jgi:hypothetical protein